MRAIRIPFLTTVALLLLISQPVYAQRVGDRNLDTCMSGKYPALCRRELLSPEEQVQVRAAELRENLRVCLAGKYPALCKRSELTPDQASAVRDAELPENLRVCLTGKYPALCRHDLLTSEERGRVRDQEAVENLRVCMDGRYPTLCQRSLLTTQQTQEVAAAEARAKQASTTAAPSSRVPARGLSCYQSSIVSPTPFMGNDGEIFRLADGSLWEVKYEYEYMYEYYPDVVVCPSSGKLVIEGTTLNVQQITAGRQLSPPSVGPPVTPDVIESRIDGTFSGWQGETIFKLQNGQIWQQSSYAYTYHYAYGPEVLIYKSGPVYKLRVTGVDSVITVKRLK